MSKHEETGLDRVRAAIQRDRGGHLAPSQPVVICGQPDPDAMRADDPHWPGNQYPRLSLGSRIGGAVANVILCPGCLGFRLGPAHLSRRLSGIDCNAA